MMTRTSQGSGRGELRLENMGGKVRAGRYQGPLWGVCHYYCCSRRVSVPTLGRVAICLH